MAEKKPKHKINHILIVTSDAADAGVKQFRFKPWVLETVIVVLCVIIGAMIGYLAYEEKIWDAAIRKNNERIAALEEMEDNYAKLMQEKQEIEDELNSEIESLNDKIHVLSSTLTQKVQSETELKEQLDKLSNPTEFPLNGPANIEELTEGVLMCVFTGSVGTNVIATASGTVTAINDDPEYGNNIWVDHGNGYTTIYRNKGKACVNVGDSVVQGTTLFIMDKKNTRLGYQMMKDGEYINPMEMLAISG